MSRFLMAAVGCLIGASAFANETLNNAVLIEQPSLEIGVVEQPLVLLDPDGNAVDCNPDQDVWQCEPPVMAEEPRIVDWREDSGDVLLELSLFNFAHAQIVEVDQRTNEVLGVVWEMQGEPHHHAEGILVEMPQLPIKGRAYQLVLRNPNNTSQPVIHDIQMPGVGEGLTVVLDELEQETDLSIIKPRLPELLPFPDPGNKFCDVAADEWNCLQPVIHSLNIPVRERGWLQSSTDYPIGRIMKLSVTVENTARVIVDDLYDPEYSPIRLLTNYAPLISVNPGTARQKRTVHFQMQLLKKVHRIRISALNPHGSVVKSQVLTLNYPMTPSISGARWVDRSGALLTTEDADQTVYLELSSLKYSDGANLFLASNNINCRGSFFFDSSSPTYKMRLKSMNGPAGALFRVPVVLKNCSGEKHSLEIHVSPGQYEWFPEQEERLSKSLHVNSLIKPQPRIIRGSLEAVNKNTDLPDGTYYAGAQLRLNVETVDADVLSVVNHDNKLIVDAPGQGQTHVRSYFPLVADHYLGRGFDLNATIPNNPRSDKKRFFPKVVRRAKLVLPVTWANSSPTVPKAKITCAVHPKGINKWSGFYASRTIPVGNPGGALLIFDVEGEAYDFQQADKTVSVTCYSIAGKGHGLGTKVQDTQYTFGTWPAGPVEIKLNAMQLSIQ